LGLFFGMNLAVSYADAQSSAADSAKHMQSSRLPLPTAESNYMNILPAKYDQQLGFTFVDNYLSLAYNVTAVAQVDSYGYGPAYLLNGLSNTGFWYQVGFSYNWPYSGIGGYNQGFAFNYEVFAPNQSSVYPANGGGGLQPFDGPVNEGDEILLVLSFYGDFVVMYAEDWNTGSSAFQFYSAEGAMYFAGSPNEPSNYNGFFTGLMTEWYHPEPYYLHHSKITYSNYDFALSGAWMWMDEWAPSDLGWTGAWLTNTVGPIDFSKDPVKVHDLTFGGLTQSCNAYQFSTGNIEPLMTSITLVPEGQAVSLSSSNTFTVWYTLNGKESTAYVGNWTLNLNADNGTSVIISGVSTASSGLEKWVLNSQETNITVQAGSNATFFYYNLLSQSVSYSVSGGGNPTIEVTYFTAPKDALPYVSLERTDLPLQTTTYQTLWVSRGTAVSMPRTISGGPQEQWITTDDTTWTITRSNQVQGKGSYVRQFLLSFAGIAQSWQWINAGTNTEISLSGVSLRNHGIGQRVTSYAVDESSPVPILATEEMFKVPVLMNSPHKISINWVKQFQVSLDPSILNNIKYITLPTISGDTYWYDQGTPVSVVLDSIINRTIETGNRLLSYTVNGAVTNVASKSQVTALDLDGISSPQTVTAQIVKQYKLNSTSGNLVSITNSALPEDPWWYDEGTAVTAVYSYSWNEQQNQSKTNAISYTTANSNLAPLDRSGTGTFTVNVNMNTPENISINSVKQYALSVSGGLKVNFSEPSPTQDTFYDANTNITVSTNTVSESPKENLSVNILGYVLDGETVSIENATEKLTATIYFDKPHSIVFKSVKAEAPNSYSLIDPVMVIAVVAVVAISAMLTALIVVSRRAKMEAKN